MNELIEPPLCVPLLRNFNLTNIAHTVEKSTFANVVNFVENMVSVLNISSNITCEVMVPKVKGTSVKYFAQVLSKTCVIILHCQFMRFSLKGDDITIKNPEEEYKVSIELCKNHLHGRLVLFKGNSPLKLQDLNGKLDIIWKPFK